MTPAPIGSPWPEDPYKLREYAYVPHSTLWWRAVTAATLLEMGPKQGA